MPLLKSTPTSEFSEGPSPLLLLLEGAPGTSWELFSKHAKGGRHPSCLMKLLSPAGWVEGLGLHHHPCGPREWVPSWKQQMCWSNRSSDAKTLLSLCPSVPPSKYLSNTAYALSTWKSPSSLQLPFTWQSLLRCLRPNSWATRSQNPSLTIPYNLLVALHCVSIVSFTCVKSPLIFVLWILHMNLLISPGNCVQDTVKE